MNEMRQNAKKRPAVKKVFALLLALSMFCALLAGCGKKEETDNLTVRVGAMSGPTAMGMVKLMKDAEDGTAKGTYEFADLSTDPSTFVAPLTKGDIDIASVPSNLASVIYNNTNGGVQILAVNTLGVLNIVERGDSVQSIKDLAGKKVYATGQGATPEYTLRHILKENGIDPDSGLTIQWCADTTEALSYIANDSEAIAMLPQPFATAAMGQVDGLRVAIDLNDAWAEIEHPQAVETFLSEYEASVAYTNDNAADAAELIAGYGIVAKAPLAEKAIPKCHITFLKGQEMKDSVSGYLQILFDENPQAVGGTLPADDFYYGL